jgi:hypothetical protein
MNSSSGQPLIGGRSAGRAAQWLTGALAALATVSSVGGVFFERRLYARDLPYLTAQVWTQDLAILVLLVPVLLVSYLRVRRGCVPATAAWLGTVVFLTYVYAFYGMTLHFSRMFLVHCLALGAAVHLLAVALLSIDVGRVRDWFGSRTARTPAIAFLTLVPVVFAAVWLVDVIPSEIHDTLPEYAVTNGFISSPVHLLDLGIFFPGLLIAGLLLRRRHPLGFLLAPALLVFAVVMTSCLVEQSLVLTRRGFDEDLALTAAFGAVTAVGATILVRLLRHPRSRVRQGPDQVIATRAG